MRIDVAIIGGTGVGDRLGQLGGSPCFVPTEYGVLRGRRVEHQGVSILLVSRHSAGHRVPPHRVNYSAIAMGLKALGVEVCFGTAAVGSLREEWGPGTMVVCSDFIDLTFRNLTLFNRTVEHRDFSAPFGVRSRDLLIQAATRISQSIQTSGNYVGGPGPRYETPAEIQAIHRIGGDLVGMTASSEAIVLREAGIDYGCLAIVTNLAAGIATTPLNHLEVVEEMERSGTRAVSLLLEAAAGVKL